MNQVAAGLSDRGSIVSSAYIWPLILGPPYTHLIQLLPHQFLTAVPDMRAVDTPLLVRLRAVQSSPVRANQTLHPDSIVNMTRSFTEIKIPCIDQDNKWVVMMNI